MLAKNSNDGLELTVTAPTVSGLTVSGVSHAYGSFEALHEVALEVEPGRVHCLLGPSGSGKSTLLRLVAGLERLQSGVIRIAEAVVADRAVHIPPERRSIGFVFQDYALFPHLDVRGNVGFGMASTPKSERAAAVRQLLARLDMSEYAESMPHTLSGGQQQRVALARALARSPEVMLMDEPFSGLDARLREDVRSATLDVLRQERVATLLVTHDPNEALAVGDQVSVIVNGRILQTGSPSELYRASKGRDVADLFGPVNVLPGRVRGKVVSTACGGVPFSSELADGATIEILVRPEGLVLSREPKPSCSQAEVTSASPRGATVAIELTLPDGRKLEASEPTPCAWKTGDSVFVGLKPGAAIVLDEAPAGCNKGKAPDR